MEVDSYFSSSVEGTGLVVEILVLSPTLGFILMVFHPWFFKSKTCIEFSFFPLAGGSPCLSACCLQWWNKQIFLLFSSVYLFICYS